MSNNNTNEYFPADVLETVIRHYLGVGVKPALDLDRLAQSTGLLEPEKALSALIQGMRALINESIAKSESSAAFSWPGRSDEWLNSAMDSLGSRERRVIELRFGILDGQMKTLEEVGVDFGVTRERIRQIERKALDRLNPEAREFLRQAVPKKPSRNRMVDRARILIRQLSSKAGEEVHPVSELTVSLSADPDSWPFGFDVPSDIRDCDPETVLNTVVDQGRAIWLNQDHTHIVNLAGNNSYEFVTAKLLNVFDHVSVDAVHDGIAQTWRRRADRPGLDITVDELAVVLIGIGFDVSSDGLVTAGKVDVNSKDVMAVSPIETSILECMVDDGYYSELEDLRKRLPALKRIGSTESQYLMGKSPLFERLGPSLYGVRGAPYDVHALAMAESEARSKPHVWNNRAGWDDSSEEEMLSYRLSLRREPPDDIGLSEAIAFWIAEKFDGFNAEIRAELNGEGSHLLLLRRNGGSIRLHGLAALWNELRPARGDLIDITKLDNASLRFSIQEVDVDHNDVGRVEIDLGRGWVSASR
jgi:hypothetical protein